MPPCEYSYYVTSLSCNQFYRGERREGEQSSDVPPGHPLEPPLHKLTYLFTH